MRAQNVLLTHFSSRYPTMPRYLASSPKGDGTEHQPTVALAMDHACIRVGDLWKMAMYFPAIKQSFKDIKDEGDDEEEASIMKASLTRE
jgi:ribonuclease Z